MARKQKPPPEKPSKAYLVSFGDTMTALLAFFIVLNSFAKEQTGANMYSGTGSFMNAVSNIGLPGGALGHRSKLLVNKKAPQPIYAIESDAPKDQSKRLGPDEDPDDERVIDRQTENFKRFLNDVSKKFEVNETPPTQTQIVFDSFEQLAKSEPGQPWHPMEKGAVRTASDAIMKLGRSDFKLEIVVWANMPGKVALVKAMKQAAAIQQQIDSIFRLNASQKARLKVTAKPWLFSDAARPKISFVVSRLDLDGP